jgi:hypothetical protein
VNDAATHQPNPDTQSRGLRGPKRESVAFHDVAMQRAASAQMEIASTPGEP